MVGKWHQTTLGSIATKDGYGLVDGPFGSNLPASLYTEEGVPVIRGSNLTLGTGRFRAEDFVFVSSDTAKRLERSLCRPLDIVFTKKGTLGQTGLVPQDGKYDRYLLSSNQMKLTVDRRVADPLFVYYFVSSPESTRKIIRDSEATGVPKTNVTYLREFPIVLPALAEQCAIAHILGTLDDKIELNQRMNETLEAMARALFKSWFVDFDPARANAEGRDPGFPKPLADLFPDSFEDSELGQIPRGWEVGGLGDFLCQRVERCAASSETAALPYVPIDCISSKSLFLSESKPGEEAQSSLTKFYKRDILFGAMRPYFHKVCIAPFNGTTRTTAFVLYPRQADDFAFATFQLHQPDTIDFATRHSTGSTIPYAVWTDSLDTMPVVAPPQDVRKAFNHLVRPILERIPKPYFENRTLSALRDTLLPKLISGELRIQDAKSFVKGKEDASN